MVYILRAFAVFAVGILSTPLWHSSEIKAVSATVSHSVEVETKFLGQTVSISDRPSSVPFWAKCAQHWETARLVGWKRKDMMILDRVMYKESRCLPGLRNAADPEGGSRGLTQINGYWYKILKNQGIIGSAEDLYDPTTNLRAALLIHTIQVADTGWGWSPWAIDRH